MMLQQKIDPSSQSLEPTIRQADNQHLELLVNWTYQLHQHEDDKKLAMHQHFKTNLTNWLQQEINNPNCLFLIAEDKNKPVGFISGSTVINDNGFLLAPMKGMINLLWVESDHRNKKIAALLLNQVEKCFASIGITYIECHFTAHNKLAQDFWHKKQYYQSSIMARKILS